ncbi:MAG: ThiF family adenylyltransferase [Acidimicrobiaceae bacterium]|nr:ThiF family adenylyltransferase [Acidimicrobiaceae bacterium]
MQYTLTITEDLNDRLKKAVFGMVGCEGAAYIACGVASLADETRLLARDIIPVRDEHYLLRKSRRLSIDGRSFVPVAKRAKLEKEAILFVHSHPEDSPHFSIYDDEEEPKLMEFFNARAGQTPHGSLLCWPPDRLMGRILTGTGWQPIVRIRVIGNRFRFFDSDTSKPPLPVFYDRQIRAFGPEIQLLLSRLHVGVVGAGGTGSATVEQLARLGVGTISIFDGKSFTDSNVTRVHGSTLADAGMSKAVVQEAHVKNLGLDTKPYVHVRPITDEYIAKQLRSCDLVFGCTDKQGPRAILERLALFYLIPVIDMAVKVDSQQQVLRGVWGRVTTLLPGEACFSCRGTINPTTLRAEKLPPEQYQQELAEGYITELITDEPAVIMFTTAVSAQAVSELLHRLTGFMGADRVSSEVLLRFHESRIRTNCMPAKPNCYCQQRQHWGRGDSRNFLGLTW